jgi:hypothetical protein
MLFTAVLHFLLSFIQPTASPSHSATAYLIICQDSHEDLPTTYRISNTVSHKNNPVLNRLNNPSLTNSITPCHSINLKPIQSTRWSYVHTNASRHHQQSPHRLTTSSTTSRPTKTCPHHVNKNSLAITSTSTSCSRNKPQIQRSSVHCLIFVAIQSIRRSFFVMTSFIVSSTLRILTPRRDRSFIYPPQ